MTGWMNKGNLLWMAAGEGARRITDERLRQLSDEGYTPEHDIEHGTGDLAIAARCYIDAAMAGEADAGPAVPVDWPWEPESWKPSSDPVRNLEKAGALIAAEIDRRLA